MVPIHNRMPVILPRERYAAWLDPMNHAVDALTPMLCAFPSDAMCAVPVSTHVNSPAHDDPRCLEPVNTGAAGGVGPGELFPR